MKRLAAGIVVVLTLAMCGSTAYAQVLKTPYLIYPGNVTQTSIMPVCTVPVCMEVLWQDSTTQTDTISLGLSATSLGQPVSVGEWVPPGATTSATNYVGHQHNHMFTGLAPDTKYYYQVKDGKTGTVYPGSFITAPADNATSAQFLGIGDSRSGYFYLDAVMKAMTSFYKQPGNAGFQGLLVHDGDWVNADAESNWTTEWFGAQSAVPDIRYFTANTPIDGCKGNHEDDGGYSAYFDKYMPFPYPNLTPYPNATSPRSTGGNEYFYNFYWSFDYGPVHFTMIDEYSSMAVGSPQYNWVETDLATTKKPWKFVIYHEPSYTAGTGHTGNTAVTVFEGGQGGSDLFTTYNVDVIYSGHNHDWSRNGVYNKQQAMGDPISPNIPHFTSGGSGAGFYSVDLTNVNSGQSHTLTGWLGLQFMAFAVQGNTMQMTTYQVNNATSTASISTSAGLSISPIETTTLTHFTANVSSQVKSTISCPNNSTACTLTLTNNGAAIKGTLDVVLDGMMYLQGLGNANAQYGGSNITTGTLQQQKVAINAGCGATPAGKVCPYALVNNVTLVNATGSQNGEPLIQVSTTGLAAGKSISVPLQFSAPIAPSKINPIVYQQ